MGYLACFLRWDKEPRLRLKRRKVTTIATVPNIVLVHGAWADGYTVTAPQFHLTSLSDNVARLRQVLVRQRGPTLVAGHSYGGHIITALGTDAPNVVGLVYIAGFGLDEGESIRAAGAGRADSCHCASRHRPTGVRVAARS